MKTPIAIIVLTRDEPVFLEKTVDAILSRTLYPFELFIVDNYSNSDMQKSVLTRYKESNINVIFNNKNEWLLGFNKAIDIIYSRDDLSSEYMVLTDGDIVVPNPIDQICWLEYLKKKMDSNLVIGKLGIFLDDLEFTKNKEEFSEIYKEELSYTKGPMIDDTVVAPVDTTLAIYRTDLFVTGEFIMTPGHSSLVKPYYYVCRTNNSYTAEHLGFKSYSKPNLRQIKEKVVCFTKYSGFIAPQTLENVDLITKYYHKIFRHLYKLYWAIQVVYYWVRYISKRFPRNLNEIQSKTRYLRNNT